MCIHAYFWKHFKVICAPTKSNKKKVLESVMMCLLTVWLRGERRRGKADSKANAGPVGVLNMN